MAKDIKGKTYNDFSIKELVAIQEIMSTKNTLTPSEASIWLEIPIDGIYKLIRKKKIVAFHPFGATSKWLIDVKKTMTLMENY